MHKIGLGLLLTISFSILSAHAADLIPPTAEELAKIQAAAPVAATAPAKQPRKVLVFSLVPEGYVHDAIPYGQAAIAAIGKKTGAFETVISDDPEMFAADTLKQFDVVVFNNANNEVFLPEKYKRLQGEAKEQAEKRDAELKASLLDFIKSGKGIVVLHASLAIFREWPEWGDIIGGRFDNHPWNAEVTIHVEDPAHSLAKAFGGDSFKISDEIYQVKGPYDRSKQRVLARVDLEKSPAPKVAKINRTDGDLALAWIKPHGNGRVFYDGFGHLHELYWNPMMLQFLCDGIQFAAGDLAADMTPVAMAK